MKHEIFVAKIKRDKKGAIKNVDDVQKIASNRIHVYAARGFEALSPELERDYLEHQRAEKAKSDEKPAAKAEPDDDAKKNGK